MDQNHWVNLAQAYHNHPDGKKYKAVLKKLTELVDKDKVRLPLSAYHFLETLKIKNKGQKERLAEVMTNLSQGWGMALVDSIAPVEIQIAGARIFEYPLPQQPKVFARDLSLILDIDLESIANKILRKNNETAITPESLVAFTRKQLATQPNIANLFLTGDIYDTTNLAKNIDDYKFGIEQFAQLNKKVQIATESFANSQEQLKRKVILDYLIGKETKETLNNALSIYSKTIADVTSLGKGAGIKFIESIPALDMETNLVATRNMQKGRENEGNDWADLRFLVVAVPYCDIVVTEKFFRGLVLRSKLDKKYKTIVLRDLTNLLEHI